MIQMTAPTRDKIKATRAKGRPIKKPRGLQSPMVQDLGIKGGGERLLGKKRVRLGDICEGAMAMAKRGGKVRKGHIAIPILYTSNRVLTHGVDCDYFLF